MAAKSSIDPALRRFLDERAAFAAASLGPTPRTDAERALATRTFLRAGLTSRGAIEGLPNPVTAREVALSATLRGRLLRPDQLEDRLAPLLLHFHGGGFVSGDPDSHEPFARLLAEAANVCVLLVDYRLAPESPYPAALEDGHTAWEAARIRAAEWRVDPQRFVLSGDSAGANLAAVLSNRLHAMLAAQVLLFPITDHPSAGHASYAEPAWGFGADFLEWVWMVYAPGTSPDDPSISPLRHPALPPLPPTFVATAQYDILRDQGLAYVDKLRVSGTLVTHHHAEDMHHNFFVNPATVARFPQCSAALAELAAWLRKTLGSSPHREPIEGAA